MSESKTVIAQGSTGPTPVRTAVPAPTDSVVDAWFASNFYGLPISTDLFNRFQTAKESLKEQLRAAKKE